VNSRQKIYLPLITLLLVLLGVFFISRNPKKVTHEIGTPIDSLNGVYVFYNGPTNKNISGRNTTHDNYNLGLKYQCVEFMKRYYYEHLNHKMPNSYGNAIHFFEDTLADGQTNEIRDLTQYTNPSVEKPKVNDIIIFDGTLFNEFGHVAIVSKVNRSNIEIIQQNSPKTRENLHLKNTKGKWLIKNKRIKGWLRKNE
jgi:surface antigen